MTSSVGSPIPILTSEPDSPRPVQDQAPETPILCSTVTPTIGRFSLERAVRSALDQGIDNHEIIVVNDSGKPLPPADWMNESKVRVITTNKVSVTGTCNTGAAIARGKYVNFLHDDDYLLPGGLKLMIDTAENNDCRWLIGSAELVDDDGKHMDIIDSTRMQGNILGDILAGECPHMSYTLVERAVFFEMGGFDPTMRMDEDRDLVSRLALKYDVATTKEPVASVRASGGVVSAFDFRKITQYSRKVRERVFNTPESLARLRDSVKRSGVLRGRVSRSYIYSGLLNMKGGQILLGLSRLLLALRIASYHFLTPDFWRGISYK